MSQLYVRYFGRPLKVSYTESDDVDDFIHTIKERFSSYFSTVAEDLLTLHNNHEPNIPLNSSIIISELVNDPNFKNSLTVPLLIRYAGQVDEESAEDRASKKRKTGMFI